jgi:hydrogenase maturation factor HypE
MDITEGYGGYGIYHNAVAHTLHAHVDKCMQIEDVACQIMKNNLQRAIQEWICTSKAEMTREA